MLSSTIEAYVDPTLISTATRCQIYGEVSVSLTKPRSTHKQKVSES